jgi:hydroxymethylbilane synthase
MKRATGIRTLRIGTRGSALALWQASWVGERLQERFEDLHVEYVTIKTQGDKILDVPLGQVGGKALFVKELEEALLANRVGLAVHSLKDIPTELPSGLQLMAIPKRDDPRDVLISRDGNPLERLRKAASIGTSSLRRRSQILYYRPDLMVPPVRGNLDTRLKKLHREELDAIVLAAAGIRRMGLQAEITEIFSPEDFVPAVGQGALGIEVRADDEETSRLVRVLDHLETRRCVQAERAFLSRLQGGCQVPIGAYAKMRGKELHLKGMVAALNGRPRYIDEIQGDPGAYESLGRELAERMLNHGAREVLDGVYRCPVDD